MNARASSTGRRVTRTRRAESGLPNSDEVTVRCASCARSFHSPPALAAIALDHGRIEVRTLSRHGRRQKMGDLGDYDMPGTRALASGTGGNKVQHLECRRCPARPRVRTSRLIADAKVARAAGVRVIYA